MPIQSAIHSFPRQLARQCGVKEAVVLKYFAHMVRKSKKLENGKMWTYDSLTKLQPKLPYISRSVLATTIDNLEENELIEVGNHNKWKKDRTQWFHVPQPYLDQAEQDLISFDVEVAKEHGIPCAVLYFNLQYWLKKKAKEDPPVYEHTMSPSALAKYHPYWDESTIKRALKKLVKEELITKTSKTDPIYSLPEHNIPK